jgi:glycosyltransferase involved in cell wall biosynthesis
VNIAVLLSTYNSELYIIQQLNSIINQTFKSFTLYIIDDGSSDKTVNIINSFIKKYSNIVFLNYNNKGSKPLKSFIWLLENVNANYYLFSDHDDIWIENKIEISLNKINENELLFPNKPILVHTDLIVVDKNLNIIDNSFWKLSKINPKVLNTFNYLAVHNGVVGCTMIFNNLAKQSIKKINKYSLMHDSWITLCVLTNNGIIGYIETPTVYYRQHNNNVIGFNKPNTLLNMISLKIIKNSIISNYLRFKMINQIQNFSIQKYFKYKILYLFLR